MFPTNYECEGQLSVFDYVDRPYKITKPIRLIELFADEDFDKAQAVNSNTQLYKQAGNSIVKNVLCEVFRQLIE